MPLLFQQAGAHLYVPQSPGHVVASRSLCRGQGVQVFKADFAMIISSLMTIDDAVQAMGKIFDRAHSPLRGHRIYFRVSPKGCSLARAELTRCLPMGWNAILASLSVCPVNRLSTWPEGLQIRQRSHVAKVEVIIINMGMAQE